MIKINLTIKSKTIKLRLERDSRMIVSGGAQDIEDNRTLQLVCKLELFQLS